VKRVVNNIGYVEWDLMDCTICGSVGKMDKTRNQLGITRELHNWPANGRKSHIVFVCRIEMI